MLHFLPETKGRKNRILLKSFNYQRLEENNFCELGLVLNLQTLNIRVIHDAAIDSYFIEVHTIGSLPAEVLMNYEWENSRDEDVIEGRYANYFKVGQNAFEFLIDFGQFYPNDGKEHFHTRIIISPFYANVFLKILQESIEQYVQTFGPIPADGEDE